MDADAIVVGASLAGLVAAQELICCGRKVALIDQENEANLGGQAFWSLGGLFLVNSPEQRRWGVKDSFELAWNDWLGSAQFDRVDDEDLWAMRWAHAYVEFAAGEKRSWVVGRGIRLAPIVGGPNEEICGPSNRQAVGEFTLTAQAVIITTGGIGGNHEMVRRHWPGRLGKPGGCLFSGRQAGRAAARQIS
jgi:predicted oxidoreductase